MNSFNRNIAASLLSRIVSRDQLIFSGIRHLYSAQALGVDKYAEARKIMQKRFENIRDNFYNRLKQQLNSSAPAMIFTEDLKAFVHIADDKPEDLEMLSQMLKRFHKQNQELRFGTFVFGPVVCRLLYYLQKPEEMLQFLKDEELNGFFDQLKSYILSMDLLYKHGHYQEVINLNERLKSTVAMNSKYPREGVTLTAAACYKLNTPESLEYAANLITSARQAGAAIVRIALHFVAALALNQNKADVALEILSSIERNNNIVGNNLKLLSFAKLNRVQDCLNFLRGVVSEDVPNYMKVRGQICQSVLEEVQKCIDQANDTEISQIFKQLCESLTPNYLTSQALDDFLCAPIEPRPFINEGGRFMGGPRSKLQDDDDDETFERGRDGRFRRKSYGELSSGF